MYFHSWRSLSEIREIFRTPSSISGGKFLKKIADCLLLQKGSFLDVQLGCKYASGVVLLFSICVFRILPWPFWSSCPERFCRKNVLRNFAKFTGKRLYQRLSFKKFAGQLYLKKSLWHSCFPENFAKFLRTPFLQNTSGGCIEIFFRSNTLFSKYMGWRAAALQNRTTLLISYKNLRKFLVPSINLLLESRMELGEHLFWGWGGGYFPMVASNIFLLKFWNKTVLIMIIFVAKWYYNQISEILSL